MDDPASQLRHQRFTVGSGGPGISCLELGAPARGPCLVILGGVHGDEPQGVRAAAGLAARLAERQVDGWIRIVPISHEAAFEAGTRSSPLDGANLARTFPGAAAGSPTAQLAALLDRAVIDGADVLIDLHSAGLHYAMPLLVGYCDDGSPASRSAGELADVAGLPVVWRHPGPPAPGRTGSGPHARGVPFVYLESTDGRDDATSYIDAVERIATRLGLIAPSADAAPVPQPAPAPRRLAGSGDLDAGGVLAPAPGLLRVHVDRLDAVIEGQLLATLDDPRAGRRHELHAPGPGVVAMVRRSEWVGAGALVVFLTQPDELARA